jgi:phosphonatase-like hydrolase
MRSPWQLACIDMAGTTVRDDGLVVRAFTDAIASVGLQPGSLKYGQALATLRDAMGQSKIDVFRRILNDEATAIEVNMRYEYAYAASVAPGLIAPIAGAADAIMTLRRAGVRVALMTSIAPPTRDAVLGVLGWSSVMDVALSPADVGRGRPYPDMILEAARRLYVSDIRCVVVVGDTVSDVLSGVRAGAGLVAGVLTGFGDRAGLRSAGAAHVLGSVAELPSLLGVG